MKRFLINFDSWAICLLTAGYVVLLWLYCHLTPFQQNGITHAISLCGNIRKSVNQSYFAAYLFTLSDFVMSRFVNTTLITFEFAALNFDISNRLHTTHAHARAHTHRFLRKLHLFKPHFSVKLCSCFVNNILLLVYLENSHSHKASLPSLPPWCRHFFFPLPVIGPPLAAWFGGANLPNCHSLFQTRSLGAWTKNWYHVLPRRGGCEDIFSFKFLTFFVIMTIIPMSLS